MKRRREETESEVNSETNNHVKRRKKQATDEDLRDYIQVLVMLLESFIPDMLTAEKRKKDSAKLVSDFVKYCSDNWDEFIDSYCDATGQCDLVRRKPNESNIRLWLSVDSNLPEPYNRYVGKSKQKLKCLINARCVLLQKDRCEGSDQQPQQLQPQPRLSEPNISPVTTVTRDELKFEAVDGDSTASVPSGDVKEFYDSILAMHGSHLTESSHLTCSTSTVTTKDEYHFCTLIVMMIERYIPGNSANNNLNMEYSAKGFYEFCQDQTLYNELLAKYCSENDIVLPSFTLNKSNIWKWLKDENSPRDIVIEDRVYRNDRTHQSVRKLIAQRMKMTDTEPTPKTPTKKVNSNSAQILELLETCKFTDVSPWHLKLASVSYGVPFSILLENPNIITDEITITEGIDHCCQIEHVITGQKERATIEEIKIYPSHKATIRGTLPRVLTEGKYKLTVSVQSGIEHKGSHLVLKSTKIYDISIDNSYHSDDLLVAFPMLYQQFK